MMPMSLDDLKEAVTWLPFVGLTQRARSDGTMLTHPLAVRLAEAAIIGAIVLYGTVQQAEQRMRNIEAKITELQEDTKEIRQQLRLAEQELWRRNGLDKMHLVRMP